MELAILPLAFAAGAVLPLQAGANAQLAKATGSPFIATILQLAVGALLLLVVALVTRQLSALSALQDVPWWHAVGGVASAFYVVAGILLFPRIGAVVSVGLFIVGQVLASALLDGFGLLGVHPIPFGPGAAIGIAGVIAGAALIVIGQSGQRFAVKWAQAGWVILGLAAGAVLPLQGAINAMLRLDLSGATFAVGTISFFVATAAMTAVQMAKAALGGAASLRLSGLSSMPSWGWLGGFAGAGYVTAVFLAIPFIGAATTVGLTVAGQQFAALLVDRYGLLRLPQRPVSVTRLTGVGVLLAGVSMIKLG